MLLQSKRLRIAYFVSSHGFGHAARTRTILQKLQRLAEVSVFSVAPKWFWGDLQVTHFHYQADIGCIQKDTLVIDEVATLDAYTRFQIDKESRFRQLAQLHEQVPFDLIATDIAPEPLAFASRLRIKSVLIANFTWVEIYEPMVAMQGSLSKLQQQYLVADATLIPSFQTGMNWARNATEVDIVAELGTNIRHTLDPDGIYKRLIYIDAGRWGTDIGWNNALLHPDTLFIRLGPKIDDCPQNVLQITFGAVRHADIVKSVDLVVAKPGYGIVTECLANQTPWACIPRSGFAEDEVLIKAVESSEAFLLVNHHQLMTLTFPSVSSKLTTPDVGFDGADQIANLLVSPLLTSSQKLDKDI